MIRVGQDRIYAPYMTVHFVISLPEIPHIHRIYKWFWPTLQMILKILKRCAILLLNASCIRCVSLFLTLHHSYSVQRRSVMYGCHAATALVHAVPWRCAWQAQLARMEGTAHQSRGVLVCACVAHMTAWATCLRGSQWRR